jgi:hypothetical protein
MKLFRYAVVAIAIGCWSAPAWGANLLTNGDFETGNFNGWTWTPTTFAEPTMTPSVVSFDTSGTGASLAFRVNPGTDVSHYGIGQDEGGALSQSVPMVGGTTYHIQVGASAIMKVGISPNVNGGRIRLMIDGNLLWDWSVDFIDQGSTLRNSFHGDYTPIVGGNKTVSLLFTRTFQNFSPSMYHFVDNLSVSPVPEPSSIALVTIAVLCVMAVWRRKPC